MKKSQIIKNLLIMAACSNILSGCTKTNLAQKRPIAQVDSSRILSQKISNELQKSIDINNALQNNGSEALQNNSSAKASLSSRQSKNKANTTKAKNYFQSQHLDPNLYQALIPNSYSLESYLEEYINRHKNTKPNKILDKFDILAEEVELRELLLSLSNDSDLNFIIDPKLSGKTSLHLKNVTIPQIIATLGELHELSITKLNGALKIAQGNLQTRSFKINYLDINRQGHSRTRINSSGLDRTSSNNDTSSTSSDSLASSSSTSSSTDDSNDNLNSTVDTSFTHNFWQELRDSLSNIIGNQSGRKITVSPISGMITVTAMPSELAQVERFLETAERSLNRQVIIEAKIIEVELKQSYRTGINWSMLRNHLHLAQLHGNLHDSSYSFGNELPISSGRVLEYGTDTATNLGSNSAFGGILTLGFNFGKLAGFIELLSSQGKVQVLSSPRVATLNNQKALIKVGSDQFAITNVSTTTTSSSTGSSVSTPTIEFDSFFSGIALDVTPHIDEANNIILHIHPTISNVTKELLQVDFVIDGTTNKSSYPVAKSSVRESDTIIRAKNGEVVIIGGLMQDTNGEITTGVPIMKDLPAIGKLFQHKRKSRNKSELVILLRPLVLNNQNSNTELTNMQNRINNMYNECQ